MVPQQKFDKPGRSPYMSMDLVPVYADEQAGEGGVAVSARVRQSLGMRMGNAEMTELRQDLVAVGYVQADERRIGLPPGGRRARGGARPAGRWGGGPGEPLARAARRRLELLGMGSADLARLEQS